MGAVMPLEADTRLLIDRSLENLGWNLSGTDKNVFFEQPRTEEERQKLEHKRPDYVLYSDRNEPLIVIEAKRKGQRIDKALEQGISYAERLKAPLVFATDGVFCKSFHTFEHKTPLLNGNELDEFIRQALAIKFLNGAEVNTVSPKVQYDRKELIQIFDYANNLLRGDGLSAGLERFSEFSNILFLKLLSEKGVVNDAYSWDTIKKIPLKGRIDYINSTVFKALNEYYNDTMEIFTPLTMTDNEILDEIIKSLDPLTLTDVDSDIKGDAFEYFLKASTATGNDLGEYFTPRHIVKTMVRLVNPQIGEKVYDPFCGTGGFLIESFRYIYNNMARNEKNINDLKTNTIFGNEITKTARIAKMNMILAGDGHSGIQKLDSLANPINGKYDVVLANMPYSQRTKWGGLYDIPSKNGDSICVQHCMRAINSTSENGRMALVVPEGFLFRKDLAKTREYLLERSELQSIISLPQGVFLPYTGVKTDIIFATKVNQKIPSSKKRKNYWYFDVKSDGYSLDSYRRKLDTPSDLQKYEEYRKLDDAQQNEMLEVGFQVIPLDKVKDNDFNFVGNRYREINITTNYKIVKFNEIATLTRGVTYSKDEQVTNSTDNIVLPANNIIDGQLIITKEIYLDNKKQINDDKKLYKDDIFICMSSGSKQHIGKVAYIKNDTNYYAGGFMGIIRTNKNICISKYLYYYLNFSSNYRNEIQVLTQGANINNISNTINGIFIPLPPIEIQQQIVEELENYQNIIDGAKQVIEKYQIVLPEIKADKTTLDKIFIEIKNGKNVKQINEKGLYRVSRIETISKGFVNLDKTKWTNEQVSPNDFLQLGDILFSHINSYEHLAKTALFNYTEKVVHGCNLIKLKPNKEKIIPKFALYIFKSDEFIKKAKSYAQRAVNQASIRISDLKTIEIPLPSLKEQEQIVAQIEAEQELINANKKLIEIFTQKIQDKINELFE